MDIDLPHILVAEREFLIALDAEYLLKSAINCRVTLLRPEQLDTWEPSALSEIDLCLLDVPLDTTTCAARIERLIAEGVPLIITTVSDLYQSGVEGFEIIPVVTKPFDGEALAEVVRGRLRKRPQPAEDQN